MATKRGSEYATIDVVAVCVQSYDEDADEICIDTANKITTTMGVETNEKKALVIKNVLISQKPQQTTVTGNTIVLTDNVFNAELVQILQGGEIKKDELGNYKGYTPPVAGARYDPKLFKLITYSAIYSASANIIGYERCEYPNCQGVPVSFSSEDDVFRAVDYTINSSPDHGEPPYDLETVPDLPEGVKQVLATRGTV